jgi:hypothetical protein
LPIEGSILRYPNGEEARLGDTVRIGESERGVVVCSLDTREYSEQFPRSEWEYLGHGILVKFERLGLVHYAEPEPALALVERRHPAGSG